MPSESSYRTDQPPRASYRCPHCQSRARVRGSRVLSPLYSEQLVQCLNAECGHTYKVGVEVLHTISPSATPNPDVRIPSNTHPCAAEHQAAQA